MDAGVGTLARHSGAEQTESRVSAQRFENVERIFQMVQRTQEHSQTVFAADFKTAIQIQIVNLDAGAERLGKGLNALHPVDVCPGVIARVYLIAE